MSSAANLLCMTSLIFLIGCNPVPECSWSAPIEFEQETKDWLEGLEWPPTAFEDFDEIGDHNTLYRRNCG